MDLRKLLKDLYAERRWLETMIGGLEVAARSPAHQFTGMLVETLRNAGTDGCIAHLPQRKKTELARLARLVRSSQAKQRAGVNRRLKARLNVVSFAPEVRRKEATG